jgi:DNA-binding NarL/FixJ family response regulator
LYDIVRSQRSGRDTDNRWCGSGAGAPEAEKTASTVAICERTALFRESLANVVTSRGHQVVWCVSGLVDALLAVELCRPDVLLLDVSSYDRDCLTQLRARWEGGPAARVLLLTASGEDGAARAAVDAGLADGLLHHAADLSALERALTGRPFSASQPRRTATRTQQPDSMLTAREHEVMSLLLAGRSTDAIALTLGVMRSTVHSHVQSILRKLGARSRVEAVSTYLGETTQYGRSVLPA